MDRSRVHLVGIGGDGMVPLAELLRELGAEVTGSDVAEGPGTRELKDLGVPIRLGHRAENVVGKEAVVFSSAIPHDNPELVAARRRGIPVIPRLVALKSLLKDRRLIAVCGTHGKTTTAAWAAHLLRPWGVGFYVGAGVRGLPRARWGTSPWFVAEVDESDGLFVELSPDVVVLTNVDRDHLSSYGGFPELLNSFGAFVAKARVAIVCADDPGAVEAAGGKGRHFTYGISTKAMLRAEGIRMGPAGTCFSVSLGRKVLGEALIPAFGLHNVRNALAALGVAHVAGIPLRGLLDRLPSLPLPSRRLEVVAENGYVLVDDYAHHPREIAAGIRAIRARWPGRRLLVLFQPHRFSRTALLHRELGEALAEADFAVVTEIYPAFEPRIPGISGRLVTQAAGRASFVADAEGAVEALMDVARPGDVLACFGAGDIWKHFRRIPEMF